MRPDSSLDLAEDLVQLLLWSSTVWGLMRKLVRLRNLPKHQRQSRNQQSFNMEPDAQELRTLKELLRTLVEL